MYATEATVIATAFVLYFAIAYEIDKRFKALDKRIDDIILRVYNFDGHGPV